ncbi:tRNA pseudouridine synthase A [Candidatus Kinetoplastibacterium desouzaii TCC079E]|uniref:tRNA pseudouridine synthase A n=1 Tax=Candidatus Kinetoplastidibacterium desouzai TCC079E TaxID=1208919 RepID=M1L202_9PROT|nr:tRNA pseudouridine(38-40) synthase TruA [Candidatus Kinetoplastibacterium desouzaii]AGF46778.1 tRNA pseudouridine synthase A [Candidatus Kinetoplastibacterium desouzaii TCC079E]
MKRIAIGLSYNGVFFNGWQSQLDVDSVQDSLEKAILRFTANNKRIRVTCAGRTDKGVHATLQVVHFDTDVNRKMSSWVRGINTFLPSSVSVHWAKEVTEDFHARFSAISRTYTYVLYCGRIRPSIYKDLVGWCIYDLNLENMLMASEYLIGLHDFSSFRASGCQSNNPVRFVHYIEIKRNGHFIFFKIKANAFLYHMVRNIIGSLIEVGKSIKSVYWIKELLESKNRSLSAPTFSPSGLYLSYISYPDKFNLFQHTNDEDIAIPFL